MFSKLKYFIAESWLLLVSSFLFGLLIAVADAAWSAKIAQNKAEKLSGLMTSLVSDANSFEIAIKEANLPGNGGQTVKTDIYKALDKQGNCAGFAFIAAGTGFADKIELVIAVDARCEKLFGFNVLSSNETPGFGDKMKNAIFSNQFKGAPTGKLELIKIGDAGKIDNEIVAISGATVTSTAVINIFNKSIKSVKEQLQQKGLITGNGG
ncbi:MAG: FMN-binding protein [Phycisphaerae bacterium]|nr:FMN-binding protein [Phycisphaerae bacterium]